MSVVCEQCNKSFTKRGLPSHIRQKHPKTDNNLDSKELDKSITESEPESSSSKSDIHWLDISTEDGTLLSSNATPVGLRKKGFYKLDKNSGNFVEADYDEGADWFRVSCKYCGQTCKRWDLRKHYVEAHLQANNDHFVLPNIFNVQTTSFSGTLSRSDAWPIDFSLAIQDDPLLKYDQITYSSYFSPDSNFKSSNELQKCFKYSVSMERIYSFNYVCPLCDEKISCVALNIMKLVVLVHLRVRHRDNGLLIKMCEEEM
uniref:C2H2-type domain-containing protein n=1 Tax=Panagrolaimus superbus TaxID=310955 RepID=A0A914YLH9_9BILA